MKKCIILLTLFFIYSCASQSAVQKEVSQQPPPISEIPAQTIGEPVLSSKDQLKPLYGELLSNVTVSKSSFNPSHGETIAINYLLSEPAGVTLHVIDLTGN